MMTDPLSISAAPRQLVLTHRSPLADWHALVADEYVWHALAVRTLGLASFHTPLLQAAAHAGVEAAPAPASWHDLVKCMEQLERPYGWTVVGDPCPAASSADARSHMPGPAPLAATIPSVRLLSSTIAWDRTWLAVPEQRGVLVPNAPRSAAQLPTVHLIDTHTEYPMWSYTPTSPGNGTVTALSAVRHGEWLIMQWSCTSSSPLPAWHGIEISVCWSQMLAPITAHMLVLTLICHCRAITHAHARTALGVRAQIPLLHWLSRT